PTPLNVPGEIYIGGEGLARGYLGRPDLTAERFVPDPFSDEPGARLYRTGDLGRHRADGNLEYLGRSDSQVKVRGYRVELGEIEAVLSQHAEVSEAVVALREDGGERRLVGYVVPAGGAASFSASRVREHLKERLPEYMMPSALVALERMPLTPNGKVDRRALPASDDAARAGEGAYAPPATQVEELLAGLWAKALGLARVGVGDDFFELGGDSILSIQLANRAAAHGVRFAPRQVFQHRTIRALASALGASAAKAKDEGVLTGEVPLTPIQRWFFEHDFEDGRHWNQSIMLEAREPLDAARVERALRELVLHHDALRLRFERDASGWRQFGAELNGDAILTESDLSGLADAEREGALREFAYALQSGLDLSGGRLMRAGLVRQGGGGPDLLLIVIHHLAVDIVSWSVLLEGLQDAYGQLGRGEGVKLPPKTTTYREWAARLAEHADSPKLRRELAFWLGDAGAARDGRVPVDFAGGSNTEASARKVKMSLGREETRALSQEVPKVARVMINDLLLAALALAYARWSGSDGLLVDLENHGREEIFDDVELNRTVGWFTCIFPARLSVGASRKVADALKAVEERVRRAPNGGIGYGLLRYVSGDAEASARLRAMPRAEVSLNYVGRAAQGVAGPGLFAAAREVPAPSHSPRGLRPYVIEINGGIDTDGRLQMTFTYSENLHRRSTVERLGEEFMRAALDITEHCLSKGARAHFPAGGTAPSAGPSLEEFIAGLDEDED
ncbi:MAG TPA: condensation domain-containing protein, partial [Pyrinomonadaceae bacterium]|nr:condensation domain-containing protein [Pyrinomonadaceae bacterium]